MVPYSFFEFSLCLSRACLGKMFAFIYKLLKKTRGRYRWSMAQRVPSATRHRRCARTPSNRPFLTPQILPRQALYLVALGGFGSETRWFVKTSFAGSTFAKTALLGAQVRHMLTGSRYNVYRNDPATHKSVPDSLLPAVRTRTHETPTTFLNLETSLFAKTG